MSTVEAARYSVIEVLEKHRADAVVGLTTDDVNVRARIHGPNEMEEGEQETLCQKYIDQFKEPLILLLLGSAIVSALMRQYDDALSIAAAVVIVSTVAFVQEYRSEKSLEALNKLVPPRANVLRDGHIVNVMARDLVPGDVIQVGVGDRIPADCRLISCTDLLVDESSLTGEALPAEKTSAISLVDERRDIPLAERSNIVFMGTLVCNGYGKALVVGTGMKSEFGKTYEEMRDMEHRRTPLQAKMDTLAKQISIVSLGVIVFIGLLGLIQGKGLLAMFQIGVSLAVAAIPEGLPICVTVTLALGVMRMAKRHAIIKKLPSVEALGCATVVCVDKTGTLTQNQMTVKKIVLLGLRGEIEFTEVGYSIYGSRVLFNGAAVAPKSVKPLIQLLEAASICNNAQIEFNGQGREPNVMGQSTELALLVAAAKFGVSDPRPHKQRVYEIPFNSDRKFMEVVCQEGTSGCTYVKGMLEAILPNCESSIGPDGQSQVELRESDRSFICNQAAAMAKTGLRVLAVAWGEQKNALVFGGLIGMMDPPRPGVKDSIAVMRQSKIRVAMVTGDSRETAESIAETLGFYTRGADEALSGQEIEYMTAAELETVIRRVTVFYRTSPRHKLAIVRALQAIGEVVAMTGDGVNDAAALKQSDIGVAMGQTGTDVAKEAASMIMVDDNFKTITYAVEEGKSIFCNIKNFLTFQLSTSVAALMIVALATLMGLDCPLNPMQILWINIIMDGPPAQSLGVEPVDPAVMRRPPRRASDPILNRGLGIRVLTNALLITAGTLYVYYKEMDHDDIVSRRDTTMTFATFVAFDMWNALACRHAEKPVFLLSICSNLPFVLALGGSFLGQLLVIFFPPLQEIFQTEALTLYDLFYILCLTSSLIILDTVRKLLLRPRPVAGGDYPKHSIAQAAWQRMSFSLSGPSRRRRAGATKSKGKVEADTTYAPLETEIRVV